MVSLRDGSNFPQGGQRHWFAMTAGRVIMCRCRLPHQSADWFAMTGRGEHLLRNDSGGVVRTGGTTMQEEQAV